MLNESVMSGPLSPVHAVEDERPPSGRFHRVDRFGDGAIEAEDREDGHDVPE